MLYSGGGGIVSAEATRQRRNPDRQQIVTPLPAQQIAIAVPITTVPVVQGTAVPVTPVPRTTGAAVPVTPVPRTTGAASSSRSELDEVNELELALQLSRLDAEEQLQEETALATAMSKSEIPALRESNFDRVFGRHATNSALSSIDPVSARELYDLTRATQLSRLDAKRQKELHAESLKKFEEDTELARKKSLITATLVDKQQQDKQQQLLRRRLEREQYDRGGPSNYRDAGIRRSRKMRKSKRRKTRKTRKTRKRRRRH
jgi:hypothetical protein